MGNLGTRDIVIAGGTDASPDGCVPVYVGHRPAFRMIATILSEDMDSEEGMSIYNAPFLESSDSADGPWATISSPFTLPADVTPWYEAVLGTRLIRAAFCGHYVRTGPGWAFLSQAGIASLSIGSGNAGLDFTGRVVGDEEVSVRVVEPTVAATPLSVGVVGKAVTVYLAGDPSYEAIVDEDTPTGKWRMAEPLHGDEGAPNGGIGAGGQVQNWFQPDGAYSLEVWIRRFDSGTRRTIFAAGPWGVCVSDTDGTIVMRSVYGDPVGGTSWGASYAMAHSSVPISDDDWHHLVVTKSAGATCKIYLDTVDVTVVDEGKVSSAYGGDADLDFVGQRGATIEYAWPDADTGVTTVEVAGDTITAKLSGTAGVAASHTTNMDGDNNDLVFTAKEVGVGGNSEQVRLECRVAWTGVGIEGDTKIVVQCDGSLVPLFDAAQIRDAINALGPECPFTAALAPGNDGTGLPGPVQFSGLVFDYVSMAGGTDGVIDATATDVKDALEADVDAMALLDSVEFAAGQDGTGVIPSLDSFILLEVVQQIGDRWLEFGAAWFNSDLPAWAGWVDRIAVYNHVLAPERISTHFDNVDIIGGPTSTATEVAAAIAATPAADALLTAEAGGDGSGIVVAHAQDWLVAGDPTPYAGVNSPTVTVRLTFEA